MLESSLWTQIIHTNNTWTTTKTILDYSSLSFAYHISSWKHLWEEGDISFHRWRNRAAGRSSRAPDSAKVCLTSKALVLHTKWGKLQRDPLDPVNAVKAFGSMCSSKLEPRGCKWVLMNIYCIHTSCGLFSKYRFRSVWEDWQSEHSFIRRSQPNPKALSTTESVFLASPFGFHSQPLLVVCALPQDTLNTGLLSFLDLFWIRNRQWMVTVNISGELTMRQHHAQFFIIVLNMPKSPPSYS